MGSAGQFERQCGPQIRTKPVSVGQKGMECAMNQVVCLSTANWHPYPTRKQQVMSRLKNTEVLYFDPPVSLLAPLKDKSLSPRMKAYKKAGERLALYPNITVCAMPPVLPFFNKFRLINKINQWYLARYVNRRMREYGFSQPVIWAYSPTSSDILEHLPAQCVVYDCVDRHAGYQGLINPEVVNKMERDLAGACDMVFATASGLYDTLKEYNTDTYMIPNGVNYALFSEAQRVDLSVPEDLSDLQGPIFGFIGMLQECIDYDLIIALAKARPDCTIVFVGKPLPGVDIGLLKTYRNIRFCGLKPQSELPSYLARFNVCINPFRAGSLSKDVSPLKFYEYLASGKPIVSTPQPEQVLEYRDVVYIAENEESFVRQCEAALKEEGTQLRERRIKLAQQCSWDARVGQIEERLCGKKILIP